MIRLLRRCTCLLAALAAAGLAGAAVPPSEAELKAVFLLNFGSYVQWPDSAQPAPEEPFVIAVWGSASVAEALEAITRGERVRDRRVQVRRVNAAEEVGRCHILFLAAGVEERAPWPQMLERPILTVGETELFEQEGGIVRFLRDRNRIKLVINRDHAQSASLVFSSRLLRLAQVKGGR